MDEHNAVVSNLHWDMILVKLGGVLCHGCFKWYWSLLVSLFKYSGRLPPKFSKMVPKSIQLLSRQEVKDDAMRATLATKGVRLEQLVAQCKR